MKQQTESWLIETMKFSEMVVITIWPMQTICSYDTNEVSVESSNKYSGIGMSGRNL